MLHILIPCYNEERRLFKNLQKLVLFLSSFSLTDYRVVMVNDGSTDKTLSILESFKASHPELPLTIVTYSHNKGKGHAVKTGTLRKSADRYLMMDADLATDLDEIASFREHRNEADLHIGQRPITQKRTRWRKLLAGIGNTLVRMFLGLPYRDTQCGFKLRNDTVTKRVRPQVMTRRRGFDIELLLRAKHGGCAIISHTVKRTEQGDSKLSLKSYRYTLLDLIRIAKQPK